MIYYSRAEENGLRHCFCTKCHRDSRGGIIISFGVPISKAKLEKKKNEEEIEEAVRCYQLFSFPFRRNFYSDNVVVILVGFVSPVGPV